MDEAERPTCPYCGEPELIERAGAKWACYACRAEWIALNEDDKVFLRIQKIRPD